MDSGRKNKKRCEYPDTYRFTTSSYMSSLRWHYPNQVMGQSNPAYSQPALCKLPVYLFLVDQILSVLFYYTLFLHLVNYFCTTASQKTESCPCFLTKILQKNKSRILFRECGSLAPCSKTSIFLITVDQLELKLFHSYKKNTCLRTRRKRAAFPKEDAALIFRCV